MVFEYDLSRFIDAHKRAYERALGEIRGGYKASHWMWYIFPQLQGLGRSSTARYYAIRDIDEARAFIEHPYLGANLREISEALLQLDCSDPVAVMGWPDDLKLRSSMTLFSKASEDNAVFLTVLDKYYGGQPDSETLNILARQAAARE